MGHHRRQPVAVPNVQMPIIWLCYGNGRYRRAAADATRGRNLAVHDPLPSIPIFSPKSPKSPRYTRPDAYTRSTRSTRHRRRNRIRTCHRADRVSYHTLYTIRLASSRGRWSFECSNTQIQKRFIDRTAMFEARLQEADVLKKVRSDVHSRRLTIDEVGGGEGARSRQGFRIHTFTASSALHGHERPVPRTIGVVYTICIDTGARRACWMSEFVVVDPASVPAKFEIPLGLKFHPRLRSPARLDGYRISSTCDLIVGRRGDQGPHRGRQF